MSLLKLSSNLSDNLNLTGKVYLITGAANGIGCAVAKVLAQCCASVILLDKDDTALNKSYDLIKNNYKGEPILVHQDLTLLTQNHCDALASQIQQSFGRLDGLVHCAAETGHLAPVEHYSEQDWSNVIRTNLHSAYLLTRTLIPLLQNGKSGTVIFSGSQQAIKSTAFWGAFAVAQQGLKGLIETWSQEIENSTISMLMLDPGKVNTGFIARLYPGLNPNNYPDPMLIAQAYVQLVTTEQSELNGKVLRISDLELEPVS